MQNQSLNHLWWHNKLFSFFSSFSTRRNLTTSRSSSKDPNSKIKTSGYHDNYINNSFSSYLPPFWFNLWFVFIFSLVEICFHWCCLVNLFFCCFFLVHSKYFQSSHKKKEYTINQWFDWCSVLATPGELWFPCGNLFDCCCPGCSICAASDSCGAAMGQHPRLLFTYSNNNTHALLTFWK